MIGKIIKKKRILVGHPYWGRGGAEIAAMWMVQALLQDYRVDVVTRGGWHIDELNRAAGTVVRKGDVHVLRYAPFSNFRLAGALWLGFYRRFCRIIAPQYDLCITASRVIDWGVPAIHFLSDVTWNQTLQKQFKSGEFYARKGAVRFVYWKLGDLIAGKSGRSPEQHDLFVANSRWTAHHASKSCSNEVRVIFPPVLGNYEEIMPWDERENSFVCLGRVAPEKNIEQVISILNCVKESVQGVTLHIVGPIEDTPYCQYISSLCESRKEWIIMHGGLYGEEKEVLLSRCRYGLSACAREAFGMATAEMMKAGVVPFVPQEGAQHELVTDQHLRYESNDDAVKKICAVLASDQDQIKLHQDTLQRAASFSPETFTLKVRELVQSVLSHRIHD